MRRPGNKSGVYVNRVARRMQGGSRGTVPNNPAPLHLDRFPLRPAGPSWAGGRRGARDSNTGRGRA